MESRAYPLILPAGESVSLSAEYFEMRLGLKPGEIDLSLINGLSFAMKKQGYEVDVSRTSLEAEQLWMDGKYDLVILDVSLPDGSGYDLCRKIRQTSKVPIIFLTAADEETDIIMGLDIGGDDYITKPFKLISSIPVKGSCVIAQK